MEILVHVLPYTLLCVVAFGASGTVAAFWPPQRLMRSYLQHFAAGVVFAAAAVEVLPDVMHRDSPIAASIGFAVGVAVMLGIRALTESRNGDHAKPPGGGWSLLVVIGVDVLIDGLLLGAGFAAGQRLGVLLALALSAEFLSLGPATAARLAANGVSLRNTILVTCAVGTLVLLGGVAGSLFLASASNVTMEIILAFGTAALLYLVTEELLVEAHEAAETPFATALFFVGFLAILIIGMVGEHAGA